MISQLSTLNSVKRFGTDVRYLRWSTYIHFVRTVGGRCVGRSITGYTYDPIHVCSLLMTVSFLAMRRLLWLRLWLVAVPTPKIAVNVVHIIAARAGVPIIGISFISL